MRPCGCWPRATFDLPRRSEGTAKRVDGNRAINPASRRPDVAMAHASGRPVQRNEIPSRPLVQIGVHNEQRTAEWRWRCSVAFPGDADEHHHASHHNHCHSFARRRLVWPWTLVLSTLRIAWVLVRTQKLFSHRPGNTLRHSRPAPGRSRLGGSPRDLPPVRVRPAASAGTAASVFRGCRRR